MRFTDETEYFVSEASVYRLLKAHDLITSPAYIVIKASRGISRKLHAQHNAPIALEFAKARIHLTRRIAYLRF